MTGIIKELSQDSEKGRLLRDKFVFYLIPILNPDGVARGHYRVDTNGINLNRCYINPSPKNHSPIYAIKKMITHFHSKGKYFAFLDLHAHAARKGVFIYGNSTNELDKQV
jgi:murein tripeptide amidase MpaA